jgi:circadian clock protein KaiB
MVATDAHRANAGADARLLLLVAGDAPRSRRARANLAATLDTEGITDVAVEEVDVLREPRHALNLGVFATPALVWTDGSSALSVLYGELSDRKALLDYLASWSDT